MRTTRLYAAGFGTAGSVLAVAAILFLLGSAIVALQGWPRIASQTAPAAAQVNAAPASPSRVSRRLRAVILVRRVTAARPAVLRSRRTSGAARPVGLSGPARTAPVANTARQAGSTVGGPIGSTVTEVSETAGKAIP